MIARHRDNAAWYPGTVQVSIIYVVRLARHHRPDLDVAQVAGCDVGKAGAYGNAGFKTEIQMGLDRFITTLRQHRRDQRTPCCKTGGAKAAVVEIS
jgi:hypothetical protein